MRGAWLNYMPNYPSSVDFQPMLALTYICILLKYYLVRYRECTTAVCPFRQAHLFRVMCSFHLVLQSRHKMLSNYLDRRGMIEMVEIEMIGPFCIAPLPSF